MTKLIVIGLDGATFDVIKPLCSEGKLPVLSRLLMNGAHGVLQSVFPPVTGPAWAALATGKNPGKTGIFDSLNRIAEDSFETRLVGSAHLRRAKPYWDYLSDVGLRVGVVNYPFLYPPYEINGIMVSGLGSSPEDQISYPRDFKQRLIEKCGKYQIMVPWEEPKYYRNPRVFVKDTFDLLEINDKTLQLSLDEDLDVLTFVISATDFAQHCMWRYFDPSHPYYREDQAKKYRPMFVRIWERVDEILGSIIDGLHENANVIIVSDHGFGPRRCAFYTGSWLEQEGYLIKEGKVIKIRRLQEATHKLIMRLSPYLYDRLVKAARGSKIPYAAAISEVQLENSLAISLPNASLVGKICTNTQGTPFKKRGENLRSINDEIAERLKETCQNLGLSVKVYYPHELYTGKYMHLAPDILFEIEDGECSIHYGFGKRPFQKPPPDLPHSGIHKKEGVLIGYGPNIEQGVEIRDAKIHDIAPTVLHMLGLPVPDDMDGRVLKGIFAEDCEPARREVSYQKVDMERERIKHRIRKLRKI